ncbi:MAG: UDP-N-acetylglucosamine--N-acetylmuramyl-(pentapeptide) pyrophosphoryl-undecaprenol N-acetylglucosamine transferase [Firmicutes bacterium]|nr:UDP-N-acetylglucosamine--N-acetylmuramyl-(pentapeptide) pyrophosphoryl-undecaprenol N-acetylglucosamine transferase [Bacillota bacterium]
MEKPIIVFTGGGTAGHIMPNIALIEQIKNDYEIHYIGSINGMEKNLIAKFNCVKFHTVETIKFRRSISIKNFAIPFKLIKGVKQARKLLKKINPDIIFSKGGFVALPITMAAKKNYPVIIHESDMTLGLANKLALKKAKHVLASFDNIPQAIHTGLPLRQSIFLPKQITARPVLLIMGGSSGALKINNAIKEILPKLLKKFDIMHLVGKGKTDPTIIHENYKQLEFSDNIGQLYARASIVISRGGATALFELIALKIPSLIIPLPKGTSRGDQILNTEYFLKKGLVHMLKEEDLENNSLLKAIENCAEDKNLRESLNNSKLIDGTKKIIEIFTKTMDT